MFNGSNSSTGPTVQPVYNIVDKKEFNCEKIKKD